MAVLCFLLTAACGFDYCRKRIPNWLVLVLLIHGCVLRFSQEGAQGILGYMANAAVLTVLLYPLFKIKTQGICPSIRSFYSCFFRCLSQQFFQSLN